MAFYTQYLNTTPRRYNYKVMFMLKQLLALLLAATLSVGAHAQGRIFNSTPMPIPNKWPLTFSDIDGVLTPSKGGLGSTMTSCVDGTLIRWDGVNVVCDVGVPTINACGTSPAVTARSTDLAARVTVGTGIISACTVTFSKTLSAVPQCLVQTSSGLSLGYTVSTTSLQFTALGLAGLSVTYLCWGAH